MPEPSASSPAAPPAAESGRWVYLDATRGLAALTVVCTHFLAAFYPAAVFGSGYRVHEKWELVFNRTPLVLMAAGHFAVCLFFVLSGLVLSLPFFGPKAKSSEVILAALLKRPFRLGGIVLGSVLVGYVVWRCGWYHNLEASRRTWSDPWFRHFWHGPAPDLPALLWDMLTGPFAAGPRYNPVLWTISLELYGSALTFIFLLLFRGSRWRYPAYLLALFIAQDSLYQGFFFGIAFADLRQNHGGAVSSSVWPRLSLALLALGLLMGSYPAYVPRDAMSGLYAWFPPLPGIGGGFSMVGAAVTMAGILLSPAAQHLLAKPALQFLGRISFAVYAIHSILLSSLAASVFLALREHGNYRHTVVLTGLIYFGVVISLSYLVTRFVDEPSVRVANAIARAWRRSLSKGAAEAQAPAQAGGVGLIPSTISEV